MTIKLEDDAAIESALARVANELADIAKALERLESLVAFIASASSQSCIPATAQRLSSFRGTTASSPCGSQPTRCGDDERA
jgi:hypothetical protein